MFCVPFALFQGEWVKMSVSVCPFGEKCSILLCGVSSHAEGIDYAVVGDTSLNPAHPSLWILLISVTHYSRTAMSGSSLYSPYASWGKEAVWYGRPQGRCAFDVLHSAHGPCCLWVVTGLGYIRLASRCILCELRACSSAFPSMVLENTFWYLIKNSMPLYACFQVIY